MVKCDTLSCRNNVSSGEETISSGDDHARSDPTRCAELYNATIQVGFEGSGKAEKGDRLQLNWFEVWHSDPLIGKCREAFTPQFTAFLELVDVQVKSDGTPASDNALTYHLGPISSPSLMLDDLNLSFLKDHDFDNVAFLFPSNLWMFSHRLGTFLEMDSMLVWYIPTMHDAEPDEAMWFTLENYLEELYIGICSGRYAPIHWERTGSSECIFSGWKANPWTDDILDDSLAAYQALVQAIVNRLPAGTIKRDYIENKPSAMSYELPPDIFGFPRAFLTRARKPPFKYIAPGLTVYDPSSPTRPLPTKPSDTDIFQTSNREINDYFIAKHCPADLFPAEATNDKQSESSVRPGLWILPGLEWADEVTLVLPYELQHTRKELGKRYSRPSTIQLFQHADCPFYAPHRTFLAVMLRRWTELVEGGIWKVNSDGVEGGVEFYRQVYEDAKRDWFAMGVCWTAHETKDIEVTSDGITEGSLSSTSFRGRIVRK